ncbi:MAG TPA: 5'-deoxyadenosine deaminase [Pyrinomonadaceae bacterium]|jgi:cytosine/adenosine deaminase-related metal-dependent hydrolase
MNSILIKGGTLLTMDRVRPIVQGDLLITGNRISSVGDKGQSADVVIDATDSVVLPGFIQTHIHLCQTLFRGSADDLSLIDWLKMRVWPMEAAHTASSVAASARLGIAELIKSGTTSILSMETVSHTAEVFKVVEESGFRATVGKCMMDKGDEVPAALHEQTAQSIEESLALLETWHGKANGRIRYCFAPRFAISCTRELLETVARLARERGVIVHTHASENINECAIVESESGLRNIAYLNQVGITGEHVVLAHCVHLNESEIDILKSTRTNVAHCPSSNSKLGSGIAPIKQLLSEKVAVSLGADGAACNNRLDMFTEMRLAALLQKTLHGPEALTAERVLQLATIDGAKAVGLASDLGTLEPGKKADVIVVRLNQLHTSPRTDLASTLVYAAEAEDVDTVVIDGELVMRERKLMTIDESTTIKDADIEQAKLLNRAGLN